MPEQPSIPQFPESGITAAQTAAEKAQKSQMTGKPRFSFPGIAASPSTRDQLLQALMGFSSGGQAGLQAAQLGDPLVSFLAGFGGAASGQVQAQKAMVEQKMAEMEMIPLRQLHPALADTLDAEYGEGAGDITSGEAMKFKPVFDQHMETKRMAIQAAVANKVSNAADAQAAARVLGGNPKDYENVKVDLLKEMIQAKISEERRAIDVIDEKAAGFIEKTEGIPPSLTLGQNRQNVRQMLISFRPVKKQAEALLSAQNMVAKLKEKWESISKDIGAVEGRSKLAAARVSGGGAYPSLLAYEDLREASITQIRRMFNDSGAPSNFDVDRYLGAIPSAKQGIKAGKEKWGFLGQLQATGRASLAQANPLAQIVFDRGVKRTITMRTPDGATWEILPENEDAAKAKGAVRVD